MVNKEFRRKTGRRQALTRLSNGGIRRWTRCRNFDRVLRAGISLDRRDWGWGPLPWLRCCPQGWVPQTNRETPGGAADTAAFRAQGETGDLPVHGRGALPDGHVRLQAEDGRVVRQGPARFDPHGPATDDHDVGPAAVPDRAVEVQVPAARPERRLGQRTAASHGQDGGRSGDHQDREHRGDQSRSGHHVHLHRPPAAGPRQPGHRGSATAWAR